MARKARSADTRENGTRAAEQRSVPSSGHQSRFYIDPKVWPPGMTYAWVAVAHDSSNTPNIENWQNKYRNGWRPVPRDRHPDLFPKVPNIGFGEDTDDTIRTGGQILCEKPTTDVERDKANQANRAKQQMDAINWTQAPGENPFMPRVDKSNTTFGHAAAFKE